MNKERVRYFFSKLDGQLSQGKSAEEALQRTLAAYAYVFFEDDGRSQLARASTVELEELEGE